MLTYYFNIFIFFVFFLINSPQVLTLSSPPQINQVKSNYFKQFLIN